MEKALPLDTLSFKTKFQALELSFCFLFVLEVISWLSVLLTYVCTIYPYHICCRDILKMKNNIIPSLKLTFGIVFLSSSFSFSVKDFFNQVFTENPHWKFTCKKPDFRKPESNFSNFLSVSLSVPLSPSARTEKAYGHSNGLEIQLDYMYCVLFT